MKSIIAMIFIVLFLGGCASEPMVIAEPVASPGQTISVEPIKSAEATPSATSEPIGVTPQPSQSANAESEGGLADTGV